jgi:hypothetical protein
MRFREKFGIIRWTSIAMLCLVSVLSIHRPSLHTMAIQWIVLASIQALMQVFIYWDVDSSGLGERRLWKKRKIEWQEIVRVDAWITGKRSSNYLAIYYSHPAPCRRAAESSPTPKIGSNFLPISADTPLMLSSKYRHLYYAAVAPQASVSASRPPAGYA